MKTAHSLRKICNLAKQIRLNAEHGLPNHAEFFQMVEFAKSFSDDQDTQVGCVISTLDDRFFVLGANKLPDGLEWSHERTIRPTKYDYVEHGERTAIPRFIRKYGYKKFVGSKIYLDGYPCPECARQLSLFKIGEIWINKKYVGNWTDNPIWYEREVKSKEIIRESKHKIKVIIYDETSRSKIVD